MIGEEEALADFFSLLVVAEQGPSSGRATLTLKSKERSVLMAKLLG